MFFLELISLTIDYSTSFNIVISKKIKIAISI